MYLSLLGQGNSRLSTDRNLVENIYMLPMCDVILMEIVVFILGGCHSHILPSTYSVTDPFQTQGNFMDGCVFLLFIQPFKPCLVVLFASAVQDVAPFLLFEHGPVTQQHYCRKEPDSFSENSVHTFQQKIAVVVTYVLPSLDLKAQSTVFLHFFSDLGHEKPRLRFEL